MRAPAGTTAATPLLALENIVRRYSIGGGLLGAKRTLTALDGVDLALDRGAVLGLVGESGSGKSTLARLVLGLERPDAGEIRLDGTPLAALPRKAIARRIQPVFQDPFGSLNPSQSVAEIVGMPLAVHRIGDRESRAKRVATLLDQVGLPQRAAAARPGELSGGQRQRVAIARALAIEPEILVCDEPTSALDVSVQAQILNLLADLRRETGVTILFISHDLAVVEHIADTVVVLYLGRVVETGPADAVLMDPRHPYAVALAASVLTAGETTALPDLGLGTQFPNPIDIPAGCRFHPRCPRAIDACRTTDPALHPIAADREAACLRLEPAA